MHALSPAVRAQPKARGLEPGVPRAPVHSEHVLTRALFATFGLSLIAATSWELSPAWSWATACSPFKVKEEEDAPICTLSF